MRIDGIALVVLLGVSASAVAFEPGNERVCKPSADGQSFECRDKVTGEVDAPPEAQETPAAAVASKVSAPVPAAPLPAPADDHDPTAPSTRKLPNYLMQRPQSQPSALEYLDLQALSPQQRSLWCRNLQWFFRRRVAYRLNLGPWIH